MIKKFVMRHILLDLENRDESFLAAIISGEGFTQLNRLSDIELEIEYVAILEELGAAS